VNLINNKPDDDLAENILLEHNAGTIITICGFMACGKTLTGKFLSDAAGYGFIDLDEVIEKKISKKISVIFDECGEVGFREIEKKYLAEVLTKKSGFDDSIVFDKLILALGGGTLLNTESFELIKRESVLVYLAVSFETIIKRIENEFEYNKRPLLKLDRTQLKKLFDGRLNCYEKSDVIINCDGLSVPAVVNQIRKKIKI